jgi:hypothetical protein
VASKNCNGSCFSKQKLHLTIVFTYSALRQVSSWDDPEPRRPKSRTNEFETIEDEFWSSEISNSEDEDDSVAMQQPTSRPLSMVGDQSSASNSSVYVTEENIESGTRYVALADYPASGPAEVGLKEGDTVMLVKVGCGGWWFVKIVQSAAGKELFQNLGLVNIQIVDN